MKCKDKLLVLTIVFFSISNPSLVNSANYPLKVGPTQRYLVDQTGKPFLIQGDVPYAMVPSLTNPEVDTYLADRQSRGFNSIWIGLITPLWNGYENANPPPLDRYGHAPFTTPDDFSTPNPAYFTNADWIIQEANNYGINVFMHPCYAGYPGTAEGWYNDLLSNSTNKLYNYGVFVGNRYKNQPNIVWVMYGDHDPSSTLDPLEDIIAAGIRSVDTNHLFTLDYQRGTDVRAAHQPAWLTLNTAYTDHTTYTGVLRAYQENSPMPMFLFETDFEGEHASTPLSLREQEYWCNLSGACGQLFGNNPIWLFGTGWQAALSGTGSQDFTRVNNLFLSRPWYNLVPDASHTVVTAGYGSGGDYVTTARANDGATVISYIPTGATVTMAMSNISGSQAQGWWYNPRDGSATNLGTFPTSGNHLFKPPDANDWVLVVDDNSRQFLPPGSSTVQPLTIATSTLTKGTTGVPYSAQLVASGGTGSYTWSVVSNTLPAGITLSTSGLLSGTPTVSGTNNFTVQVTDASSTAAVAALTLTVSPPALTVTTSSLTNGTVGVPYTAQLVASGGTGSYTWSVVSNTLPAGLSLATNGLLSGTPTVSGTNSFTVQVMDASSTAAVAALTLTVSPPPLTVTTTSLTNGTVGVPYSAQLVASGGTGSYTWSVVSNTLPAGLSLATNGVLSGTPTAAGTSGFTVRVTDASSTTANAPLTLVINPTPLAITTSSLTNGTVGVPYSAQLTASGGTGAYSWSVVSNTLPAGLSLATNGVLSGTPTVAGTSGFTVRVTDASSTTANAPLTLVINPTPLAITTTSLTNGTVGVPYTAQLVASGGTGSYTWSVVSNTLPAGLSLATNGLLSGTPTASGTNGLTVRVTDAGNQAATADFQIIVNNAEIFLTAPQQTFDEISQIGFRIFLNSNIPGSYLIEWTPDFLQWQPVQSIVYTNGLLEVMDPGASNSAFRFYRAGHSSN